MENTLVDSTEDPPTSLIPLPQKVDWKKLEQEIHQQSFLTNALRDSRINLSEPIPAPEAALTVFKSGFGHVPLMTLGNISLIIGRAKSKKTFFMSMLLAACLRNEESGPIKGCLPANKRGVVFFDTEQGRYHTQKVAQRVIRLNDGEEHKNFSVYSLRKYSWKERIQIIEEVIYSDESLGFVVVDGVRDLVPSINDEDHATHIAGLLMKWTEERNIHISTVLHQNKGDFNARGHLGAELVNKSETVLSVAKNSKNEEFSDVSPEYTRDVCPDFMTFTVNLEGLPEFLDLDPITAFDKSRKQNPAEIDKLVHQSLLATAFENVETLKYKDLCQALDLALLAADVPNGKTAIERLIAYYKKEGLLIQEGAPGTRHSYYVLP